MSENGAVRRWTRVVAGLRSRRAKLRGPAPPAGATFDELLGDAIETCGGLLQDLAGVQLLCDQLRHELHTESQNRHYLLDQMPVACVTTDDASLIQYANQPAAELLNVSAKHLRGRLLLHFSEDRASFGDLLQKLPLTGGRLNSSIAVRPRERGLFTLTALIVPATTTERSSWLWFLKPVAHEASTIPTIDSTSATREFA